MENEELISDDGTRRGKLKEWVIEAVDKYPDLHHELQKHMQDYIEIGDRTFVIKNPDSDLFKVRIPQDYTRYFDVDKKHADLIEDSLEMPT